MSEATAVIVALVGTAALFMWTSFKFASSDEAWIGMLAQIFHGFSLVTLVVAVGSAANFMESGYPGVGSVVAVFSSILALVVGVYAMFMIMRAVFGIVNSGYQAAKRYMDGERGISNKEALKSGQRGDGLR